MNNGLHVIYGAMQKNMHTEMRFKSMSKSKAKTHISYGGVYTWIDL